MISFLSAAAHETEKGRTQVTDNTEWNFNLSKPPVFRVIWVTKLKSVYKAWWSEGESEEFSINCGKSCKYNLATLISCFSKWRECLLQEDVGSNEKYGADTGDLIWCVMSVSQLKLIDLHTFANTELACLGAQVNQNSIVTWRIIVFRGYEGESWNWQTRGKAAIPLLCFANCFYTAETGTSNSITLEVH